MRLIDADALLAVPNVCKVTEYDESGCGVSYNAVPVKAIEHAPTIDAEPVRHGRWIEVEDRIGEVYYTCSNCGEDWYIPDGTPAENNMHYCPRCSAKMDLDEQETEG